MKSQQPLRCGNGLSPTDPSLLASPLEFISEDHMRERQICTIIDKLASSASFDSLAAQSVLRFLNEELNVHMRDEAEDLFPLLAQRCPAEDEIGRAITRIRNDLDEATRLLPVVRATLAHCLDAGCDLSAENGEMLMRFVGHVRRHLAAENAILLPIARARLTRTDLETLSQHMRSRRGISPNDGEDGAE
jgi:hemerythrin-like domain-containing protein